MGKIGSIEFAAKSRQYKKDWDHHQDITWARKISGKRCSSLLDKHS
jgi:hypothetical protein